MLGKANNFVNGSDNSKEQRHAHVAPKRATELTVFPTNVKSFLGGYIKVIFLCSDCTFHQGYAVNGQNHCNKCYCSYNTYHNTIFLAAKLLVQPLGFQYDLTAGMIGFNPTVKNLKNCLWSLGTVWGEYRRDEDGSTEIRIAAGSIALKKLTVKEPVCSVKLNGNGIDYTACADGIALDVTLQADDVLTLN